MRVLLLSNKFPYPPNDGGAIATYRMIEGLSRNGVSVDVLSLNTLKHYADLRTLPDEVKAIANFEAFDIDTSIRPWEAFKNLFSNESYNVMRFYSELFKHTLIKKLLANKYDIIHLEGLHIAIYLNVIVKYSDAKIVLRAHNVEYLIWDRIAKETKNPIKKWYLNILASRMKAFETMTLKKLDALVPITSIDADTFKEMGYLWKMKVIPTGIYPSQYPIFDINNTENNTIFHLGSLDWIPNQQAIIWFMDNVWEIISKENKDLIFYIAGKNIPKNIKSYASNRVIIQENIPDAKQFMLDKNIMIVPLLSGSGMRIKILEGLAMGKVIISTTIGAEGMSITNGKNILIADEPRALADNILRAISDKAFAKEISHHARYLATDKYNNDDVCRELMFFYEEVIEG